ncbi:NB-ARC domain-containing protein [Allokutzneria sp. A3M-2-11 16]|uniref:helix-turn-helix domain-containing protein n=1 Tax=Allokutzneria sp. A3M-2-11 16 TaxID=2962043 RepID=UPI0020B887B2|nr:helix-turn-helix domain-containing protein [Allokutzneria sp. A3M-2-11 16]MCP3803541.1 NB-ARC domain-containing protein [Allokutzneria sp. A3M-2-11 16]
MISGPLQDETSLVELGTALRHWRTASGLSLRRLARTIGLSAHSALADYERGRRIIPEGLVPRFAEAVGDADGAIAAALGALRARAAAELAELAEERQAVAEREPAPTEPSPVSPPPAAVPPPPEDFVGRDAELDGLCGLLTGGALVVLSGPPGSGRSTLAARVAVEVADEFPDGAILLGLCDPNPVEAMRKALRACGVADRALPSDVDELGARYRAVLAERRMLVVLDHIAHEDQVLPLLAPAPGCALLVTSRSPLHGLDARRAVRRCRIGALPEDDAVELIAAVLGRARVDAEPAAARRMAGLCDRWPLALRIAAARLVDWPGGLLADAADDLEREQARLAWLPADNRAVRSVLEVSYRQLDDPARRLLRRLALAPGKCFTVETAASALGVPPRSARRELDRLCAAGFLLPTASEGRARMHGIVRSFARFCADQDEPARDEVELRLVRTLLDTAADAASWLDPTAVSGRESAFPGLRAAVCWLDTERPAILAAVERSSRLDPGRGLAPLLRMVWYYELRCAWPDLRALAQLVLEQAQLQQDTEHKAYALAALSLAAVKSGQPDTGRELAETAAGLAHGDGMAVAEIAALDCLGRALLVLDRPDAARQALARAVSLRGDWWQHATCSSRLGKALTRLGEPARGLELEQHALLLFERHGDDRGAARTRIRLGLALAALDRHAEAVEQYDRAAKVFEHYGDTWSQAKALREVGNGRKALGEDELAAEDLRRAEALLAAQGCR